MRNKYKGVKSSEVAELAAKGITANKQFSVDWENPVDPNEIIVISVKEGESMGERRYALIPIETNDVGQMHVGDGIRVVGADLTGVVQKITKKDVVGPLYRAVAVDGSNRMFPHIVCSVQGGIPNVLHSSVTELVFVRFVRGSEMEKAVPLQTVGGERLGVLIAVKPAQGYRNNGVK